jgi:predicted glycoside hydrolase/deacetylase ChbG (UPF0249 family)
MTRELTLCADDYGLSAGVDAAIDDLAQRGRLSAVSCLTGAPAWVADGPRRAAPPPGVQTGLHFNLTEGRPLSAALRARWPVLPTIQACIVAAHLGRLPLAAIGAELAAQWDAFVAATGRTPDFVDGHQHVTCRVCAIWCSSGCSAKRTNLRCARPAACAARVSCSSAWRSNGPAAGHWPVRWSGSVASRTTPRYSASTTSPSPITAR